MLMRFCFVHDYLNQLGGAERTLRAMHEIWPQAPVYTTLINWEVVDALGVPRELVRYPSWLDVPVTRLFYKYFTLFYPLIFENFNLSEYDVVISSSANFAKGVVTVPGQVHINYCHTPPRFLYHLPTETNKRQYLFWKLLLAPLDFKLRLWDYTAAQRVDYFVANSKNVAKRIKKYYNRKAKVIYPPVDIKNDWQGGSPNSSKHVLPAGKLPVNYYLVVSRLSAYKNIDLAIRACARLNRPLKIVGTGPEERRLKKLAKKLGAPVEFTGFVSDQELAGLYAGCRALIFSVLEEDFGIVPVEAMSFGKPVIALRSGGVGETVMDGETGLFFDRPTTESLVQALRRFESCTVRDKAGRQSYWQTKECAAACRRQAQRFSKERFKKEFKSFVNRVAVA